MDLGQRADADDPLCRKPWQPDDLSVGAKAQTVQRGLGEALLHKSAAERPSPFPGHTYPATSVMGLPSAVKPFRTATRTWTSAT